MVKKYSGYDAIEPSPKTGISTADQCQYERWARLNAPRCPLCLQNMSLKGWYLPDNRDTVIFRFQCDTTIPEEEWVGHRFTMEVTTRTIWCAMDLMENWEVYCGKTGCSKSAVHGDNQPVGDENKDLEEAKPSDAAVPGDPE